MPSIDKVIGKADIMLETRKNIMRYSQLIAIFVVIIIINFFELTLLNYKYDLFTGGFLQPYSYKTFSDRLVFITTALWFDFALFGLAAGLWFYIANKLKKNKLLIAYNFIITSLLLMGIWLNFKFKVLSYFNDTLNLTLIRHLGGGSITKAVFYASDELALYIGIITVVIAAFIFSMKMLNKSSFMIELPSQHTSQADNRALLALIAVLTPLLTFIVSNADALRYGLSKKTSYALISQGLDKLSDIDFDGFGIFSYPKDNAVFNADIYPGALDIPGNGIDEDGFLGDAVQAVRQQDGLAEIAPQKGKHIVLIVLESARADLLEKKIDGDYIAPTLKTIADRGSAIKYAYSHTGYTTTSIRAIFNRSLVRDHARITLIDFLQSAGYQLSIISGQDESFGNVASDVGMKNEGIYYFDARTAIDDRVFPSKEQGSLRLSEERVIEQFQSHMNELDFSQPQFIYLNIQAAHFPYTHPKMKKRLTDKLIPRSEINIENRDWLAITYWNAIASADWAVKQVLDAFKDRKLLDNVTFMILGDHGESLFEDEFLGHGHAINDSQTKIPLIINDSHIFADQAIGQVDVAEIVIRSAFGLTNEWVDNGKPVFQIVGTLSQPLLIAHVKQGGVRTVFDFRSEQVFLSDLQLWKPYKEALLEPVHKARVESLIREWEALRWQEAESL